MDHIKRAAPVLTSFTVTALFAWILGLPLLAALFAGLLAVGIGLLLNGY